MEKLTAGDPGTQSADVVTANIEALHALFPAAFTEGQVDFDALRQLLGDAIDDGDEKYGLTWRGKRAARRLALTPSMGTLRPAPAESVDWDTTQNLIIEGDNLEVLKLLQKSYAGEVQLIYIDPPYNTGGDFVYPDDFTDNIRNYLEVTGQVGNVGRISSNVETSGRFHTNWLGMMYPRMLLAREMLRPDGVIFISIDDHEVAALRLLMDEVFGNENFIASVIWQKVYAPKSSAKHFSEDHEYVLIYARDADSWRPLLLPRTDEQNAVYRNPDHDPRGDWRPNNLAARNYYSKGTYSITCPGGRVIPGPPSGSYWRLSRSRFDELDRDGRIWWGEEGNNVPAPKIFRSEVKDGRVPQTFWGYKEVGHTQEAKKGMLELLDFESSESVFDTPKPVRLIERMLRIGTDADGLVLDFFAGSGTTAQAVLNVNSDDGGRRRFILVQLPEPTGRDDFRTIADVTKQRVRRAGIKLAERSPMVKGDIGFRVLKLDSSNIREWAPDRDDLPGSLDAAVANLRDDRTQDDILYELLLKRGIELTAPIEQRQIAKKTVQSIGAGTLFACLAAQIERQDAEPLALGIVAWHKELAPAGETRVVFRDSAFVGDVAKTNLAEILRQHGLTDVKSI